MSDRAPAITPVLRYRDAHAAIDFLQRAFGFEPLHVYEEGGRVVHAELTYDNGMVMVDPADESGTKGWNYVVVEDPDAHYEQAKAAGAEITREPEDQDYGSRDYSARDPEGNVWSFGTYRPTMSAE